MSKDKWMEIFILKKKLYPGRLWKKIMNQDNSLPFILKPAIQDMTKREKPTENLIVVEILFKVKKVIK